MNTTPNSNSRGNFGSASITTHLWSARTPGFILITFHQIKFKLPGLVFKTLCNLILPSLYIFVWSFCSLMKAIYPALSHLSFPMPSLIYRLLVFRCTALSALKSLRIISSRKSSRTDLFCELKELFEEVIHRTKIM